MKFIPNWAKWRGNQVLNVKRKAKEEEFALEREKKFQEDLKATADKVKTLREEVKKWYDDNENELLEKSITAKRPVDDH